MLGPDYDARESYDTRAALLLLNAVDKAAFDLFLCLLGLCLGPRRVNG